MKKFDAFTPFGILLGFGLVFLAIFTSGGTEGFTSFVDIPSILIVIGGLIAALLISFPLKELKFFLPTMRQAFHTKDQDIATLITVFVNLSDRARREGLLALEAEIEQVEDPFIRKGVLLAVDGIEPDMIVDILNAEILALEERHRKKRGLLEKAGEYAPAWGMIGTLVGLVLMLKNLDDPTSLGPNMAIALLTTFYGSLLANLVFLPMAAKLSQKTEDEVFYKQIIIEGVVGVQSGQNPTILEERLSAFLSADDKLRAMNMNAESVTNEA